MKRKMLVLAVLCALLMSAFGTTVAASERTLKAVFEDDFGGDLSKWQSATEGAVTTDGVLDFSKGDWVLVPVMDASKEFSVEFDVLSMTWSFRMEFMAADGSNSNFCVWFTPSYQGGELQVSNLSPLTLKDGTTAGANEKWANFGKSVYHHGGETVKLVLRDNKLTEYLKKTGEADSAYEEVGEVYTADEYRGENTTFKSDTAYKIGIIGYSGPREAYKTSWQFEDENGELVTEEISVAPTKIDNFGIKAPVYGKAKYKTVFTDDFSDGNLDKWNTDGTYEVADGELGVNVFNKSIVPKNVSGAENIKLSYDITKYMSGLYVEFYNTENTADFFRIGINKADVWDTAQLWDGQNTWVNFGHGVAASGTTNVEFTLSDGVLSEKLTFEDGKTATGSTSDSMIKKGVKYGVKFYTLGNNDAAVTEGLIDNVTIEQIPTFEPVGGNTVSFEDNFDTDNIAENWNIDSFYFDGENYIDEQAYTYTEGKGMYPYPYGRVSSPKKEVASDALTAELELDAENAVNQSIYMQFTNSADETDYFRVRIADWTACVADETGAEEFANGVSLWDATEGKVKFTYALNENKLTIKKISQKETSNAVYEGAKITDGASYKAGIYTAQAYNPEKPIYISRFAVSAAPDFTVENAVLKIENAENEFAPTAVVVPGENYKIDLTVSEKKEGAFAGKLAAALYDGNKVADVYVCDAAEKSAEIFVPENVVNPKIKVMILKGEAFEPVVKAVSFAD